MSVTVDDVRHVASLARLGLTEARALGLVAELNTILRHMDVLASIDTTGVDESAGGTGVAAPAMPTRADVGPPIPLPGRREDFGPRMEDGFFLVPRLATHEDTEAAS